MKAAILTRLRDRLKIAAEFSEPGSSEWRKHKVQRDLLRELIDEIEGLNDTVPVSIAGAGISSNVRPE